MEHACSKCGATVNDGVPFCPQCKAPQIRVPGFEVEGLALGEKLPGSDDTAPARRPPVPLAIGVQWPRALPAAVLGGIVSIVSLSLPLGIWGPAYAIGGAVAVFVYSLRAQRGARLTPSAGAKIGAASAGFGYAIIAIITAATFVYHSEDLRKGMADAINQMVTRGSDPQTAQQALELLKTQEGLGLFVAFALSILLVVFVVASSIGGAVCASWLRRR